MEIAMAHALGKDAQKLVNNGISYEEIFGELEIRKNVTEGIWQKRIVVLSGPSLLIYKSANHQSNGKIKRKIEFHWTSTCVEVSPVEFVAYRTDQPRPKIKKSFCFKVSANVISSDEDERQMWIQRITNNMENYKKTTECVEKHNQLVRAMKAKYGSNWNQLQMIENSTSTAPVEATPSHAQSNSNTMCINANDKAQQGGLSKEELETKVLQQEKEITELKRRLESLERTVAEIRKLQ